MPPKRNKRYTKKDKKRTGRKQKNTTFKKGGASKTLAEIVKDKLEANDYKLVQQLIDYPDRKYAILIDFCKDNKFVVNTEAFLSHSFLPPDEGYKNYNNKLTIPEDFEKGKLLEIIIYANKDGIQYNTDVKDNKYQPQNCKPEKLPVIYPIPEITPRGVSTPTNDIKELEETIKKEELKGVSEKPELKDSQDDLDISKEKTQDEVLRSREEGDVDTTNKQIDSKELVKERKEKAKKQQEDTDKLAHEPRLRAETEQPKKDDIDDEEEMWFEDVSDDEAKKEQESEKLFQKYTDEINIISGILQSIMMSGNISYDKTHRNDYTPALRQLKTKYEALIDIFNKDDTTHIPIKTKNKIIDVLTNNHRRLQALRTYDRGTFGTGLKFESNFMEKVKDSLSIMNTLKTYFKTFDESLMTNLGNKPQVSYDYTKYVDGGKKTRKNKRKTKRRKTKKRI